MSGISALWSGEAEVNGCEASSLEIPMATKDDLVSSDPLWPLWPLW